MRKHDHEHKVDLDVDYLKRLGYEGRDVSLPILIKWLVVLFAGIVIAQAGTLVMHQVFVAQEPDPNAKSLESNPRKLPKAPYPMLQANPAQDLHDFRQGETVRLDGYQWKDKAKGVVSIPVDSALDIVSERGLPTKPIGEGSGSIGNAPQGAVDLGTVPPPMRGHITDGVRPMMRPPGGTPGRIR